MFELLRADEGNLELHVAHRLRHDLLARLAKSICKFLHQLPVVHPFKQIFKVLVVL